jgi:hypothetical protein
MLTTTDVTGGGTNDATSPSGGEAPAGAGNPWNFTLDCSALYSDHYAVYQAASW